MAYIKVNLQTNDIIDKTALDHIEDGIAASAVAADVTTALATKAPIANPTFTGQIGGITKAMVGLGNVDNTSDLNKPVSTAVQTALSSKAPIDSPAFTGTPTINGTAIGTGGGGGSGGYSQSQIDNMLAAKAPLNNPQFTGTVGGITTGMLPDFTTAVNSVVDGRPNTGSGGGLSLSYNSSAGTISSVGGNNLTYNGSSTGTISFTS